MRSVAHTRAKGQALMHTLLPTTPRLASEPVPPASLNFAAGDLCDPANTFDLQHRLGNLPDSLIRHFVGEQLREAA